MRIRLLFCTLLITVFGATQVNAQCSVNSSPGNNCNWGDQIDELEFNGIASSFSTVNNNGCSNGGYGGVFNGPWTFVPGASVTYKIRAGGNVYNEGVAIWIDLNRNGSYENSEQVWASSGTGQNFNGSFVIPATASSGTTRMRVRCAWNNTIGAGQACTAGIGFGYGETEDYNIDICNPPSFTSQPADGFACEDGSGMLIAKADRADSYQWQVNLGGSGWSDVTNGTSYFGATKDSLGLTNTPATMNGARFRVIAIGCGGASRDTSDEATLSVHQNTDIKTQSEQDTSCVGLITKLSVKADGVITGYRWQIFDNTTNQFIDVPASPFTPNDDTLNVSNIPDTLNGARLRCIVTGLCGSDTTKDIKMTVQPLPKVITPPSDVTTKQGTLVKFNAVAAGVNVKYRWQSGYNDTFSNINNNGNYAGVTTDLLLINGVSRAQNEFQYRVIVSGTGSCAVEPDTSAIAVLYVEEVNSVGSIANESGISVFPNPATGGQINLVVDGINVADKPTYTIIDKTGRIVRTGEVNKTGKTSINVNELAPQLYSIQIFNQDGEILKTTKFNKL